jgi:hypothetical protein
MLAGGRVVRAVPPAGDRYLVCPGTVLS